MSGSGLDDPDRLWPAEWWERIGTRLRVPAVPLLLAAAVGVVVLVVAVFTDGAIRAGVAAWLGAFWVAILAFLLLRTKTLAWSAYVVAFVVSTLWAVVVAALLSGVSQFIGGASTTGATVVIASLGEDALKLLPLFVVAACAPARVQRFAAADWLLVGVVVGAGFLAVEELVRRTVRVWAFGALPESATTFSLLGAHLGETGEAPVYPGHHVATGVVAAAIGIAVLGLRGRRRPPWVWAAALAVPAVLWWILVARHAAMNAAALEVAVPAPFRVTEEIAPDVLAAPILLAVVSVVAMLVDATRLARWGDASFESHPPPRWHSEGMAGTRELRPYGPPGRLLGSVAGAVLHLSHVVTRDLRQIGEALTTSSVEKPSAGPSAVRTLVAMQRQMRQIAYHLDAGEPDPRSLRVPAFSLAVGAVLLALLVAPLAASPVQGSGDTLADWLSGHLAALLAWWPSLSGWDRVLTLLTAASTITLSAAAVVLSDPPPASRLSGILETGEVWAGRAVGAVAGTDGERLGTLRGEIDAFADAPQEWTRRQLRRLGG